MGIKLLGMNYHEIVYKLTVTKNNWMQWSYIFLALSYRYILRVISLNAAKYPPSSLGHTEANLKWFPGQANHIKQPLLGIEIQQGFSMIISTQAFIQYIADIWPYMICIFTSFDFLSMI